MGTPVWGFALWLVFLLAAIPYVRTARHPATKPLAAYLIFVLAFSAVAAVVYALLGFAFAAADAGWFIRTPVGAVIFLFAVFVPGALIGHRLIRKPPRRSPRI